MLCCANHISTIPPTITTTTTTTSPMQPGPIISPLLGIDQRAGESQLAAREGWREGGRKGEGGSYHVSKVGGKAFCSARNMTRAAARMEQSLALAGTFSFVNVTFYFYFFYPKMTMYLNRSHQPSLKRQDVCFSNKTGGSP